MQQLLLPYRVLGAGVHVATATYLLLDRIGIFPLTSNETLLFGMMLIHQDILGAAIIDDIYHEMWKSENRTD